MDIEFIVQDTFALTRPQWKLASNLEEAVKALQLAIAQDTKTAALDKSLDGDDASDGSSSDDQHMEHDLHDGEGEGEDSSESEDEDAEVRIATHRHRNMTADQRRANRMLRIQSRTRRHQRRRLS